MKTITLKKVSFDDLLILHSVVAQFRTVKLDSLETTIYNDAYFNNLLSADIATNLSFLLRNKIENEKKVANYKIKISEAIILMQCCNDYRTTHEELKRVTKKFIMELHKQLINL